MKKRIGGYPVDMDKLRQCAEEGLTLIGAIRKLGYRGKYITLYHSLRIHDRALLKKFAEGNRRWHTDEELLADVAKYATTREFGKKSKYSKTTISTRFGSWTKAKERVEEGGK